MKPFLASLSFSLILVASVLYSSHAKIRVKYEQIFAEKQITLAENMTLSEKLFLRKKKGFIKFID